MTTDPEAQKTKAEDADQATRTATRISVGVMVLVASVALLGLQKRGPERRRNRAERQGISGKREAPHR